jgi:hypothetical protein
MFLNLSFLRMISFAEHAPHWQDIARRITQDGISVRG